MAYGWSRTFKNLLVWQQVSYPEESLLVNPRVSSLLGAAVLADFR